MPDTPTTDAEEAPAFEVSIESDGEGSVVATVRRTGIVGIFTVDTNVATDDQIDEFFQLLPAVIDRGLNEFLVHQEGTQQ